MKKCRHARHAVQVGFIVLACLALTGCTGFRDETSERVEALKHMADQECTLVNDAKEGMLYGFTSSSGYDAYLETDDSLVTARFVLPFHRNSAPPTRKDCGSAHQPRGLLGAPVRWMREDSVD